MKLRTAFLLVIIGLGLSACRWGLTIRAGEPLNLPSAAASPPAAPAAASAPAAFVQPLAYLKPLSAGRSELRLADAAGDQAVATDEANFASLSWASNGRLGAAVVLNAGERALLIINVAAKTAQRILTAPAGGRLEYRAAAGWTRLVARREDEIWSVALPSGAARRLTVPGGALAQWGISGDGRWFLAGVEAEGHYVTTLFDLDGGSAVEVSRAPHPVSEFSDDGRWLALAGRDPGETVTRLRLVDLRALPAETATRIVAMSSAIRPALRDRDAAPRFFSSDGSWLAYVSDAGGQRLRLRELAGAARPEFPLQDNEELSGLLIQPDLRRALLISNLAGASARNARARLLYLDYQISVPFLEGFSDAVIISAPQNPYIAIDARLSEGQRYLALVDLIKGSGRIALRGRLRPLAVAPADDRALVALVLGAMEDIHLLDLRNGGALTYMGRSLGGESRPASGQFAPNGPGVWTWLWRADGTAGLVLSTGVERTTAAIAEAVTATSFSSDGTTLAFAGAAGSGAGVYLIRADGSGLRYVGAGAAPRWLGRE